MTPKDPTADAKAKPLAQAQNDFTAEGSPPPGQVATAEPASLPKSAALKKKVRGPARAPGTRNGPVPRRTHPR